MKTELKIILQNLLSAITYIQKNNLDISQKDNEKSIYDFKEKKHQYRLSLYRKSMAELNNKIAQLNGLKEQSNKKTVAEILDIFNKLSSDAGNSRLGECASFIGALQEKVNALVPEEKNIRFNIDLKQIPSDICEDVKADVEELEKCFASGCYRSAVILCGRLLETALHRRYYEATGNDMLEKSPGIGLGKIIAKLEEHNVKLDPGITQQIHLVNQVRIFSVHKKQQPFYPSKSQAEAMILYTLDVVEKLTAGSRQPSK